VVLVLRHLSLVVVFMLASILTVSKARAQSYPEMESLEASHGHDHESDSQDEDSRDESRKVWNQNTFTVDAFACTRASARNIATVDEGNAKADRFLKQCAAATKNSRWCSQLTRPNPSSKSTFACTYGDNQKHMLIHPDEKTWPNAFKAVVLVEELGAKGIKVAQIYNWWRPQPYNANVGGAAGRHPFGTSVDVRMATLSDMEKAFKELCKWRKAGRIRAVGYYGSTGLHFGIGDKTANTWGKSCPK
jgi:hypothetical protein